MKLLIDMKSVEIVVSGKVQGVFFRASTKQQAQVLGIVGTVQNRPNGTVLIRASGSQQALNQLIAWCHSGSPHSQVDGVSTREAPLEAAPKNTFEIIR